MSLLKTYSVSTDITGGDVAAHKLHSEIAASGYVTGFDGISIEGDDLEVYGASIANESSLNALVAAHDATVVTPKSRMAIMGEILVSAEPTTQLPRLLDALDKYPSVIAALDNYNYTLASSRVSLAVSNTVLTAADQTLIESKFPTGWDS